jgi:hypothetical protein
MHASGAPHSEDWDNVAMSKSGRRMGLVHESLSAARVKRSREGQNLHSHAAAQGDLLSQVDDAHSASAELPDEPVIVEDGRNRKVRGITRSSFTRRMQLRSHTVDQVQTIKAGAENTGDGLVAREKTLSIGHPAAFQRESVLFECIDDSRIVHVVCRK